MPQAQAIEELEIKLSFQDQLIDTLNHQVTEQELRLMSIERKLQALIELVRSIDTGAQSSAAKTELPPHY
jgi:SlyX protein